MELLLLLAIAYAGARGIEKLTSADRSRSGAAPNTKGGPAQGGQVKEPGPTQPGGTFSAAKAAPRSAAVGGKAAGPLATGVEAGATMWAALLEGYASAWPEARRQARERMVERAERRRTEKAARTADRAASQAVQAAEDVLDAVWRDAQAVTAPAAGPVVPPLPPYPPFQPPTADTETQPATQVPAPADPADDDCGLPGGPMPAERFLKAVPNPPATTGTSAWQIGDLMSSPNTLIPEVRTLDGLLNALTLVNAMCQMRAEEAEAVAADDLTLSNRLDQIQAELADLDVDPGTLAEIATLRETIHAQSKAAAEYGAAAHDAADLAMATAGAAHKSHGGIAEAVQSSPIEQAAKAGYYER